MASDADILATIRENFSNDTQEWSDIYEEGGKDLRILSGDVWDTLDPDGAKQRRDAKRPMIAPDELGQYVNQVVNDVRANPRGLLFSPTGDGADSKGADFYQDKTREIEYRSHATQAYTTAFENAVQRGYGYVRVNSKYVHDALFDPERPADVSLFNQELWIDAVPNPDLVLPDPYALRPDLGDQKRCTVLEWRPRSDFQRDFPGAKVVNFTPQIVSQAPAWFTPDGKQVLTAECWAVERVKDRTLLLLKPPRPSREHPNPQPVAVWQDALKSKPSSDQILQSRTVPITKVVQRITNGVEILETNDWDGQYIPITGCFGKILYVDKGEGAKKTILSLPRLAREPFLAYAYLWSSELEVVGMTPKFPYFYYEGSLSPAMLTKLAESLHVPVAAIAVKPSVPGITPPGEMIPFPQRNPYDGSALQYLEIAKEAARRAIQSAMGITPLPTPVQRENQKSGKALQQIESSGQKGSFHLVDGYDGMIRQVGVILEDKMDHTYDTARKVGIFKSDESSKIVSINDPADPESVSTKGDYQVTISIGPASESQRADAADFVDTLVSNIKMVAELSGPKAAAKVVGKAIRLKRLGPIGDQIADIVDPPQPDGQQPPSPQEQQLGQENQQLKGALQKATQVLQGEQVKYDAQFKIESMKADKDSALKLELQQRDLANKRFIARVTAAKQAADAQAEAIEEATAQGLDHAHDAHQADADRAHELGMAAVGAAHASAATDQQHDNALDQGDAQTANTLAVQAAQPQPDQSGAGA